MNRRIETEDLAGRLRLVRIEQYGEHGAPELARALGIPTRTWLNVERGVSVPGTLMLAFLELTGAEPAWLAHGLGPRYRELIPAARGDISRH